MTALLSIVIPAYNEQERIRPTLEEYVEHFRGSHEGDFEIIVVLNGCRDDTRGVVEKFAASAPEVRLAEFAAPLGKGGALREGLALAEGSLLMFVDADNMVRAPEAAKLVEALEGARPGYRRQVPRGGRERQPAAHAPVRQQSLPTLGAPFPRSAALGYAVRGEGSARRGVARDSPSHQRERLGVRPRSARPRAAVGLLHRVRAGALAAHRGRLQGAAVAGRSCDVPRHLPHQVADAEVARVPGATGVGPAAGRAPRVPVPLVRPPWTHRRSGFGR